MRFVGWMFLLCLVATGCREGFIAGAGAPCDTNRPCRRYFACVAGQCQPDPTAPDSAAPDAPDSAPDLVVTSDAGSADAPEAPPAMGTCSGLGAIGQWQEITPPVVRAGLPGPANCPWGTQAFVVDPNKAGTVYLGTCGMGIWKTADCGATWGRINTGINGERLSEGMQWVLQQGQAEPMTFYATGDGGAFRSS